MKLLLLPGVRSKKGESWTASGYFPVSSVLGVIITALTLTTIIPSGWARSICPADKGGPCDCTAKKEGVVLVCDRTKLHDVEKSLKFFREREGIVINYLTVRQSHVGRIPNGFFMSKKNQFFLCRFLSCFGAAQRYRINGEMIAKKRKGYSNDLCNRME